MPRRKPAGQPAPAAHDPQQEFGEFYFQGGFGGQPYGRTDVWLGFFGRMADGLIRDFQPRTVMDAGCAMGFLVESLHDRGVEAYGVDISEYAIGQVRADVRPFCQVASAAAPFGRRFDLVISIEVVEHMPEDEADQAVANFCQHTDQVVFSSTSTDFEEVTHHNVRPPEHWATRFAEHGFYRDVDLDLSYIGPAAVHFRRRPEPFHRVVGDYERWHHRARQEVVATRQVSAQLRDQVGRLRADLESARAELDEVYASRAWKTGSALAGVAKTIRRPLQRQGQGSADQGNREQEGEASEGSGDRPTTGGKE